MPQEGGGGVPAESPGGCWFPTCLHAPYEGDAKSAPPVPLLRASSDGAGLLSWGGRGRATMTPVACWAECGWVRIGVAGPSSLCAHLASTPRRILGHWISYAPHPFRLSCARFGTLYSGQPGRDTAGRLPYQHHTSHVKPTHHPLHREGPRARGRATLNVTLLVAGPLLPHTNKHQQIHIPFRPR